MGVFFVVELVFLVVVVNFFVVLVFFTPWFTGFVVVLVGFFVPAIFVPAWLVGFAEAPVVFVLTDVFAVVVVGLVIVFFFVWLDWWDLVDFATLFLADEVADLAVSEAFFDALLAFSERDFPILLTFSVNELFFVAFFRGFFGVGNLLFFHHLEDDFFLSFLCSISWNHHLSFSTPSPPPALISSRIFSRCPLRSAGIFA